MVLQGQKDNPDFYGRVAAAVIDPDGRVATGLNYLYGNERIHAERAAIDHYEEEYGELPKGSIVVTTLSPCNQDTGDIKSVTCTEVLNRKRIKVAYCGYRDPTQHQHNNNFTVLITDNVKIQHLCKKIADTFLKKHVKESTELDELKIDNVNGLGAVPYNQEIDHKGLRVSMRPSIFLKLAQKLQIKLKDIETIKTISSQLDIKGIGSPFLRIAIPQEWKNNIYNRPARVIGHDGRHRMLAIQSEESDDPVEVHLVPGNIGRGEEITNSDFKEHPEWIKYLNTMLVSEDGKGMAGPFFQSGVAETKGIGINVHENFADGKGPGRPGDSQRHGIPKHATMAELEKASHSKGRKGQLARWQLNMRRGHKK
jgi:pyrimidine deaminase RibD-like protein